MSASGISGGRPAAVQWLRQFGPTAGGTVADGQLVVAEISWATGTRSAVTARRRATSASASDGRPCTQ